MSPAEAGRSRAHTLQLAFGLYLPRGLNVFPTFWIDANGCCAGGNERCKSPGKHPIAENGLKDAPADPKLVSDGWRRHPLANLAIATGRAAMHSASLAPALAWPKALGPSEDA